MNLIGQLESTCRETLKFFEFTDPELGMRYGPGKWSVRELLHHLCDAETVFFDRIRRVISEPSPVIWAFDPDAWASSLGYMDRPLQLSKDIYRSTREGIIYYAGRNYASSSELEFVHSNTGVRTLKDEFDKVADHNQHHLEHIQTALKSGT